MFGYLPKTARLRIKIQENNGITVMVSSPQNSIPVSPKEFHLGSHVPDANLFILP
jgi:hypothetical protein